MTLHIDLYSVHAFHGYDGGEPQRQFEGQEAIDYATTGPGSQKGLPYWNGYRLQTSLHEDGECEAHRPEKWSEPDLVRKPAKRATDWWTEPRFSWLDLLWIYLIVLVLRAIGDVLLRPLGAWLVRVVVG